ncbi:MAG: hypothetical protein QNK42_05020 [Pseudodonghicola sp.]|nr:hypothetical protein [Pseudodonghicola sp.]
MDPVLLFGLVALAGAAVLLKIFGDEGDFAEDDPDDAGEGLGATDSVAAQERQTARGALDAPPKGAGASGDASGPGSPPEGR